MRTFPSVRYDALNALIAGYIFVTIGGLYSTFTHRTFFFVPMLTHYSYAMLAPYQGDSDDNTELAVVAWQGQVSTLLPVDGYFPGIHGERHSRMFLTHIPEWEVLGKQSVYTGLFSQLLTHEHAKGMQWDRIDVYAEKWLRSPHSYEENRAQAERFFLFSVR